MRDSDPLPFELKGGSAGLYCGRVGSTFEGIATCGVVLGGLTGVKGTEAKSNGFARGDRDGAGRHDGHRADLIGAGLEVRERGLGAVNRCQCKTPLKSGAAVVATRVIKHERFRARIRQYETIALVRET